MSKSELYGTEFFRYTISALSVSLIVVATAVLVGYDINLLRTISLTVAAVAQTLFVALYLTWKWWSTFLGRALFGKAVALLLIVDFAALSRWLDFGSQDLVFTIMYTVLATGIVAQLIAFLRVKIRNEREGVSGNSGMRNE